MREKIEKNTAQVPYPTFMLVKDGMLIAEVMMCGDTQKQNAKRIIRAVNEYDSDKATIKALLEAAKIARMRLGDAAGRLTARISNMSVEDQMLVECLLLAAKQTSVAIAQAEKVQP